MKRILRPSIKTGAIMTLCPIAIVTGCEKCPAFKICPLKGVIGDAKPADESKSAKPAASAAPKK